MGALRCQHRQAPTKIFATTPSLTRSQEFETSQRSPLVTGAMAIVMLLTAAIALPLGLRRGLFDANLKTVPVVSLIAIGAAISPLL